MGSLCCVDIMVVDMGYDTVYDYHTYDVSMKEVSVVIPFEVSLIC